MQDQPQPPLERAMWWIEHVIRHGSTKHLRSPAANISWVQYYEIELLIFVIFVIILILTVGFILVRRLFSFITLRKFKRA